VTPEKVKDAHDAIRALIEGNTPIEPKKLPEELYGHRLRAFDGSWDTVVHHLVYMTQEAKKFVDEGRMDKAMRWLGFLQGTLWFSGTSLNDLKKMNMPDAEKSDAVG
jgi:hypothetical protein